MLGGWVPSAAGDPLWAVLIPPQLARFRALTGVGDAHLDVDFTGWNKYVVLDADTRSSPGQPITVEWFERELAVYRFSSRPRPSPFSFSFTPVPASDR